MRTNTTLTLYKTIPTTQPGGTIANHFTQQHRLSCHACIDPATHIMFDMALPPCHRCKADGPTYHFAESLAVRYERSIIERCRGYLPRQVPRRLGGPPSLTRRGQ